MPQKRAKKKLHAAPGEKVPLGREKRRNTTRVRKAEGKKELGKSQPTKAHKAVDCNQIRAMAELGMTQEEMAYTLGMDPATLVVRKKQEPLIAEAIKLGRANLNRGLRKLQLRVAKKGNVSMLIFLGKQYLGQAEKGIMDIENLPPLTFRQVPDGEPLRKPSTGDEDDA